MPSSIFEVLNDRRDSGTVAIEAPGMRPLTYGSLFDHVDVTISCTTWATAVETGSPSRSRTAPGWRSPFWPSRPASPVRR